MLLASGERALENVYIDRTSVTDESIVAVARNGLITLSAGGTKISDSGVKRLALVTTMKHVGLWGTAVSDEGVAALASVKGLATLDLTGTRVLGQGGEIPR